MLRRDGSTSGGKEHVAAARHFLHGSGEIRECSARRRPEHRGAEQDGVRGGSATGIPVKIGKELAHQRVAPAPPLSAMVSITAPCAASLDDLAQAVADAEQAGDIERDKIVEVALHAEAGDDARAPAGRRRRAVAEEVGHDVEAAGQTTASDDEAGASRRLVGEPVRQRQPPAAARRALRARPGGTATSWSIAAPAPDWPPSFSQRPGTMAEK